MQPGGWGMGAIILELSALNLCSTLARDTVNRYFIITWVVWRGRKSGGCGFYERWHLHSRFIAAQGTDGTCQSSLYVTLIKIASGTTGMALIFAPQCRIYKCPLAATGCKVHRLFDPLEKSTSPSLEEINSSTQPRYAGNAKTFQPRLMTDFTYQNVTCCHLRSHFAIFSFVSWLSVQS